VEPTSPAVAPKANPVGTASLITGILLLLVSIATTGVSQALPLIMQEFDLSIAQVAWILPLPSGIVAVVATVLGVIGLVLPGRRRVAAIIGTTLGAAHLISGIAVILSGAIIGLIVR